MSVRECLKQSEAVVGAVRDCRRLFATFRAAERNSADISRRYHRAGAGQPKLITATWEAYKKAGPPLISTNRPGKANHIIPARVFYSDVAVKVAGSDNWMSAQ